MARYVDIENNEDLINAMHDLFIKCNFKHKQGCLAPTCKECIKRFFSKDYEYLLSKADVKEVVHGEWAMKNDEQLGLQWFNCSICGRFEFNNSDFCPHCGADMRGDK